MSEARKSSRWAGLILGAFAIFAIASLFVAVQSPRHPFVQSFIAIAAVVSSVCLVLVVFQFVIAWTAAALTVRNSLRRDARASRSMCPMCGYDARANEDRCSECGEPLPLGSLNDAKTPLVRRITRTAVKEARAAGCDHFGTQHLLLAIASEADSVAAVALENLGVTREALRDEVARLLNGTSGIDPDPNDGESTNAPR